MNSSTTRSWQLEVPAAVPPQALRRHLGVPADGTLPQHVEALIERTRFWYEQHGNPWALAREVPIARIAGESVELSGGLTLSSELLARGLGAAAAHTLLVLAVSAGREVDEAIDGHWSAGRPDEAMFLNACAIAHVEHARDAAVAQWAARAGERQRTLLPRYSPGYEGWDHADQAVLFELIAATDAFRAHPRPPLELLDGGGLRPAKAMLAVHGITSRRELPGPLETWWPRIAANLSGDGLGAAQPTATDRPAQYAVPLSALRKWSTSRLTIDSSAHGRIRATFRFSGTTCTNLGMPLAFNYSVIAQQEPGGEFRIQACTASPAAGDQGHRAMCGYLDMPESFLESVGTFELPVGKTLGQVLQWAPDTSPTGCLCTRASQNHKWQIVLQTLHFALQSNDWISDSR